MSADLSLSINALAKVHSSKRLPTGGTTMVKKMEITNQTMLGLDKVFEVEAVWVEVLKRLRVGAASVLLTLWVSTCGLATALGVLDLCLAVCTLLNRNKSACCCESSVSK